ncbi:hypothetical protein THIOSC13_500009 [uncultured Thiomicrorhabdus sp.]
MSFKKIIFNHLEHKGQDFISKSLYALRELRGSKQCYIPQNEIN